MSRFNLRKIRPCAYSVPDNDTVTEVYGDTGSERLDLAVLVAIIVAGVVVVIIAAVVIIAVVCIRRKQEGGKSVLGLLECLKKIQKP